MQVTDGQPFPDAKDLSDFGFPDLKGVWTASFDTQQMQRFMSEHYLSKTSASAQINNLDNFTYYRSVFEDVLRRTSLQAVQQESLNVLELGAGFGSGTRALLDLLPKAHITASDYSPAMLSVLKGDLQARGLLNRCTLCQVNAEKLAFSEESFEIVLGAALLHHLFDPESAIRDSYRVLKRGGVAVFFEPFEVGMKIISLIYLIALRDMRSYFAHPRFRRFLKRCVTHWTAMSTKDKADRFFEGIDDKWLFSFAQFDKVAREAGFKKVELFPVYQGTTPFKEVIQSHIAGNNITRVPKWFWNLVDQVEGSISPNAKRDLLTEGVTILTK